MTSESNHPPLAGGSTQNARHPYDSRTRIVLVEPSDPLNVGMVARALSNLGFSQLHLVRPRGYERARARITACHGEYLLDSLVLHDEIDSAIADAEDVIGFEPKTGRAAYVHFELNEWQAELSQEPPRVRALLFGSEDEGLSNREVELCRALVSLPTFGPNYSYNLAQAVLLGLFTLSSTVPQPEIRQPEPPPLAAEFAQLDRLVLETLCRSGFYSRTVSPETPAILKSIVRRSRPSKREVQILLGVFNQAARALRGATQIRKLPADPPQPRFRFPDDAIPMSPKELPE